MLLVGASLLIETLLHLRTMDSGFQSQGILTASAYVPLPKYDDRFKSNQFYRAVLTQLRGIPGLVSAGLTSDIRSQAVEIR